MSKWTERISPPPILTFSVYRSKFDSVYRSAFIERINGIERRSFLIQFNKPGFHLHPPYDGRHPADEQLHAVGVVLRLASQLCRALDELPRQRPVGEGRPHGLGPGAGVANELGQAGKEALLYGNKEKNTRRSKTQKRIYLWVRSMQF